MREVPVRKHAGVWVGKKQRRFDEFHVAGKQISHLTWWKVWGTRWEYWCLPLLLQSHIGIKGLVADAFTGKRLANAVIHVKNITHGRNVDIQHDVTSGSRKYVYFFTWTQWNRFKTDLFLQFMEVTTGDFLHPGNIWSPPSTTITFHWVKELWSQTRDTNRLTELIFTFNPYLR